VKLGEKWLMNVYPPENFSRQIVIVENDVIDSRERRVDKFK